MGKKNPELTVCQVRMAANAMIQACSLPPPKRHALLDKVSRQIQYYQSRNAQARRSHRKGAIRMLHRCGITRKSLRRCESG